MWKMYSFMGNYLRLLFFLFASIYLTIIAHRHKCIEFAEENSTKQSFQPKFETVLRIKTSGHTHYTAIYVTICSSFSLNANQIEGNPFQMQIEHLFSYNIYPETLAVNEK